MKWVKLNNKKRTQNRFCKSTYQKKTNYYFKLTKKAKNDDKDK
jgi:hypothetical protein